MTYPIVERFRFYPASELFSERVRGIYINPLLGISIYSLLRAPARACSTPGVSSYNFLQTYTGLYKVTHPPEGGENKRGGLEL